MQLNPLDSILLNYKKIGEAPTFAQLEARAEREGNYAVYHLEWERRYKAIKYHDKSYQVFLCQNPACLFKLSALRKKNIIRIKPRLISAPYIESGNLMAYSAEGQKINRGNYDSSDDMDL